MNVGLRGVADQGAVLMPMQQDRFRIAHEACMQAPAITRAHERGSRVIT